MPDFTIKIMQQCTSGERAEVGGYYQDEIPTEHPTCTCKGYQYHHNCKHITEAKTLRCQYHELTHGAPSKDGVCPECGTKTKYVRVET